MINILVEPVESSSSRSRNNSYRGSSYYRSPSYSRRSRRH